MSTPYFHVRVFVFIHFFIVFWFSISAVAATFEASMVFSCVQCHCRYCIKIVAVPLLYESLAAMPLLLCKKIIVIILHYDAVERSQFKEVA
jgi:hypothetical protein